MLSHQIANNFAGLERKQSFHERGGQCFSEEKGSGPKIWRTNYYAWTELDILGDTVILCYPNIRKKGQGNLSMNCATFCVLFLAKEGLLSFRNPFQGAVSVIYRKTWNELRNLIKGHE